MARDWHVAAHVDPHDVLDLATPAATILANLAVGGQWLVLRDGQHYYALTRQELAGLIDADRRPDDEVGIQVGPLPTRLSALLAASGFPPALVVGHDLWFREIADLSGHFDSGSKWRIIARAPGAPLVIWARADEDYPDVERASPGAVRIPQANTTPTPKSPRVASDPQRDVSESAVKWFNDSKGFGFIAPDEGDHPFEHIRSIECTGFESEQGDERLAAPTQEPVSRPPAPRQYAAPVHRSPALRSPPATGRDHDRGIGGGGMDATADDAGSPGRAENGRVQTPPPEAAEPVSGAMAAADYVADGAAGPAGAQLPFGATDGTADERQGAAPVEVAPTRWVDAEIEDHVAAEPLIVAETYTLAISINAAPLPTTESVGRVPAAVLTRDPQQPLLLTVSLSSNDFTIADAERRLKIDKAGLSAGKARFDISPLRAGLGRLTAILHRDNNFVQRLDISLQVGPGVMDPASVVSTGRPVTTSRNLSRRDVGMSIRPSPTGGFDCTVWGVTAGEVKLPIRAEELAAEIDAARAALLRVVSARTSDGTRPFQTGIVIEDVAVRDAALKAIALAGYTLFQQLFFHPAADRQCQALGEWLIEQLDREQDDFKLQIVARDFPVPWAMLYLAPEWKDDAIDFERFLGMKLVVEQIPLCNDRFDRDPRIPGDPGGLAVSLNLNTDIDMGGVVAAQEAYWNQAVVACPAIRLRKRTRVNEVLDALNDSTTDDQIVYFFCHAESIGLGDGGPGASNLTLSDNGSVDLAELAVKAPARRKLGGAPLVFINACESARLSPLFYNGFVPYFLSKGACGVIGTECKVPGRFAEAWAREFFNAFLAGRPIGETVRLLRRNFYQSHGNLLGLVYGLYCNADTQIDPLPPRQEVRPNA